MAISPNTQAVPATPQPASRQSVVPPDVPPRITGIDPALLPDRYCMMVEGNCLDPQIKDGELVMFDKRLPVRAGDFAAIYLKPECVEPGHHQARVKRLVLDIPPWVRFPYAESADAEISALIVAEMFNPPTQFTVRCADVLAVHHCLGPVPAHIRTHYQPYADLERVAPVSAGWSRRELLAGAVTVLPAGALATLPALAVEADHPDADLFALGREYDAIHAKINDAHDRIEIIAPDGPRPVEPEALKVRPGDKALGMPQPFDYGVDVPDTYGWREVDRLRGKRQVRTYRGPIKLERVEYAGFVEITDAVMAHCTVRDEPWPDAQARADEIVSAFDAYDAEWKMRDYDSEGVVEIEEEIDAFHDELRPVAKAIVATRAVTLDGLLVKARAVRWLYREAPEELLAEANGTGDELSRSITADLWAMQEDPAA